MPTCALCARIHGDEMNRLPSSQASEFLLRYDEYVGVPSAVKNVPPNYQGRPDFVTNG